MIHIQCVFHSEGRTSELNSKSMTSKSGGEKDFGRKPISLPVVIINSFYDDKDSSQSFVHT